jgi:hypothetical protein
MTRYHCLKNTFLNVQKSQQYKNIGFNGDHLTFHGAPKGLLSLSFTSWSPFWFGNIKYTSKSPLGCELAWRWHKIHVPLVFFMAIRHVIILVVGLQNLHFINLIIQWWWWLFSLWKQMEQQEKHLYGAMSKKVVLWKNWFLDNYSTKMFK